MGTVPGGGGSPDVATPSSNLGLQWFENMVESVVSDLEGLKTTSGFEQLVMRLGRPASWREVWHRIKMVTGEDEAIEAIGDLRELLAEEDLLLPGGGTR
jgi:hypothetical protein